MFKPILSTARPFTRRRYWLGRRAVYWTLAVVVGADLLLILVNSDVSQWWRSKGKSDITQQVTVTIQRVDQATGTIRVVGDLIGIMGTDVVVTPQTWIGIDRQLAVFGELRDGLRANISFVREGERRVARWIAASTSSRPAEPPPSAPKVADGSRPEAAPAAGQPQ